MNTKPFKALFSDQPWNPRLTYSPAVQVGNLIFLSGTTAGDAEGNLIGAGDIVAQARFIFEKFEAVLKLAGGGLSNIIETTDYVLTLDDYNKTAALRRELFGGPPWPASTGVVVSGLIRPGALIEIKAIAALGD
ncbi:RidA family protein [Ensifer adhaerens]|uniref:RidA family protein n=1 Tax=Ensifer adhaerens TaxID=106592 RepID=UPI001CBAE7F3|nr:RidA family protein [Ensifer adhaerens]MBZ7924257.1 RidA family protein [Ensifer adhaerens]UAX96490.1 RidA family protein [Ensifer adhaerens]UAY04167.1 RidA family protein [Ensifer adhaerens]UAY12153.1 RidA family protein [Ensifer adhaerens]